MPCPDALFALRHALDTLADSPCKPGPEGDLSYGLGREFAEQLRRSPPFALDARLLVAGVLDVLYDRPSPVAPDDWQAAGRLLQAQTPSPQEARYQQAERQAAQFMARHGQQPGVVCRPSGLQYEVLHPGGDSPANDSERVQVYYRGCLLDGTEIDAVLRPNPPAEFLRASLMAGWQEALSLMPRGARWRLTIPPSLAYGAQGAGHIIGPQAVLVFELELIDFSD